MGDPTDGERTNKPNDQTDTPDEEGPWSEFVGEKVVVDTPTRYIYLGTLVELTGDALVMEEVDVHDSEQSESTKEVYVMNAAQQGIRVNRERVVVPEERVLSMSTLDDTVVY